MFLAFTSKEKFFPAKILTAVNGNSRFISSLLFKLHITAAKAKQLTLCHAVKLQVKTEYPLRSSSVGNQPCLSHSTSFSVCVGERAMYRRTCEMLRSSHYIRTRAIAVTVIITAAYPSSASLVKSSLVWSLLVYRS